MNVDRLVLLMAGTLVLAGLGLGVWVNPWFLLLPAFVGCNLVQAAFTGFCPAAVILKKIGVASGPAF